jgi:prepilin-type N-terminal cleavage/methylation domain-containing protein
MTKRQSGFSLVELMVAMTVTLIVSGAIYGLLTSGGNAFRREPEVADRQQNIRLAMDLVSRDVFAAGAGLPNFSQVFTRDETAAGGPCAGATGLNGCGVMGSLGPAAAAARADGDGGDPSENTDVLEIVTTDEECPVLSVCSQDTLAGSAGGFVLRERVPACLGIPGPVLLTDNNSFVIQPAAAVAGTGSQCPSGGDAAANGDLDLDLPILPWVAAAAIAAPSSNAPPSTPVVFAYRAKIVRYRIAPSTDPMDIAPALWRTELGRYGSDGLVTDEPTDGGFSLAGSPWQLVARGIEDLQIEYMGGDNVWRSQPPAAAATDWTTLVRQVRITLSARTTAGGNLQGQTEAGGGAPDAIRGQLSTTVAPRAAFFELQMGGRIR